MKFLRIKATNFKNYVDNFTISFNSQARKTS